MGKKKEATPAVEETDDENVRTTTVEGAIVVPGYLNKHEPPTGVHIIFHPSDMWIGVASEGPNLEYVQKIPACGSSVVMPGDVLLTFGENGVAYNASALNKAFQGSAMAGAFERAANESPILADFEWLYLDNGIPVMIDLTIKHQKKKTLAGLFKALQTEIPGEKAKPKTDARYANLDEDLEELQGFERLAEDVNVDGTTAAVLKYFQLDPDGGHEIQKVTFRGDGLLKDLRLVGSDRVIHASERNVDASPQKKHPASETPATSKKAKKTAAAGVDSSAFKSLEEGISSMHATMQEGFAKMVESLDALTGALQPEPEPAAKKKRARK